jgi:hypothetical protein
VTRNCIDETLSGFSQQYNWMRKSPPQGVTIVRDFACWPPPRRFRPDGAALGRKTSPTGSKRIRPTMSCGEFSVSCKTMRKAEHEI